MKVSATRGLRGLTGLQGLFWPSHNWFLKYRDFLNSCISISMCEGSIETPQTLQTRSEGLYRCHVQASAYLCCAA